MDMFDYIKWRGDLSFKSSPMNEIDGAIFSMASYVEYDMALYDGELDTPINYKYAIDSYFSMDDKREIKIGLIFPTNKAISMLEQIRDTERFSGVKISDYVNRISTEQCYQFSAVTFHLDDGGVVAVFRGTDDTIVGWREDFNISFMREIPSQRMAVEYLHTIAKKYPDSQIYICGHSKGGNLAVYSAVMCEENIQNRIVRIFSYDGPGQSGELVMSEKYSKISSRIESFVPQSSMIGTMFNGGKYKVVHSTYKGAYQHDLYSWSLDGPKYKKLTGLSPRGLKNQNGFNSMVAKMSDYEKREFVEIFFNAIQSAGVQTLSDISAAKLKTLSNAVKSLSGINKEQREVMLSILLKMLDIRKDQDVDKQLQESEDENE